jgi:hypothetical protein
MRKMSALVRNTSGLGVDTETVLQTRWLGEIPTIQRMLETLAKDSSHDQTAFVYILQHEYRNVPVSGHHEASV